MRGSFVSRHLDLTSSSVPLVRPPKSRLVATCSQLGIQLEWDVTGAFDLVSLGSDALGRLVRLVVHPALSDDAVAINELIRCLRNGVETMESNERLQRRFAQLRTRESQPVFAGVESHRLVTEVAARFFPNLPLPSSGWRFAPFDGERLTLGMYFVTAGFLALHPVLTEVWVPSYVTRHIVHHELCHHALYLQNHPGYATHGPAFKKLELACPDYAMADAWLTKNRFPIRRFEQRQPR